MKSLMDSVLFFTDLGFSNVNDQFFSSLSTGVLLIRNKFVKFNVNVRDLLSFLAVAIVAIKVSYTKSIVNHPWINCNHKYRPAVVKVTRRTWRGTKGGRNVQRPICTAISSGKYHFKRKGSGVNCDNLIQLIDQSGTANLETFIATIATARNDSKSRTLTLNLTNLLRINKTPVDSEEKDWSFTLLNPRSVKNKTLSINETFTTAGLYL
jgi:hypothetical protein